MSTEETSTGDAERDETAAPGAGHRAEDRAEAIVERASAQVAHFARRTIARAREEVEDIVAEAQSVRRGEQRRDEG